MCIRDRLEMVEVGEHHFGELQLQQIDLFAQHEREQQVERPAEDIEVELERREAHALTVGALVRLLPALTRLASQVVIRAPYRPPPTGSARRPLGARGPRR